MAEKYFLRTTNVETTCDLGGTSDSDTDMSLTIGADTSVSATISTGLPQNEMSFDLNVTGDGPVTTTYDVSINVTAATELEWEAHIDHVDETGCVTDRTEAGGAETETTGVWTWTTPSMTFDASSERLRLRMTASRTTAHGNKTFTISCSDADSFVQANSYTGSGAVAPVSQRLHSIGNTVSGGHTQGLHPIGDQV